LDKKFQKNIFNKGVDKGGKAVIMAFAPSLGGGGKALKWERKCPLKTE
jgi:hypothetical protein